MTEKSKDPKDAPEGNKMMKSIFERLDRAELWYLTDEQYKKMMEDQETESDEGEELQ